MCCPGWSAQAQSWLTAGLLQPQPPRLKRYSHLSPQIAKTTGLCHHAHLSFLYFVETGSPYIAQASLDLGSSSPPSLASQNLIMPFIQFATCGKQLGLTLSPKLEYSGLIMALCSLDLLSSRDPPTSASQVTRPDDVLLHRTHDEIVLLHCFLWPLVTFVVGVLIVVLTICAKSLAVKAEAMKKRKFS
ncbi:Calcium-activated potassium channel subunit beta-4 [Plecturocebus cupreus]